MQESQQDQKANESNQKKSKKPQVKIARPSRLQILSYNPTLWAWILMAPAIFVVLVVAGWPLVRTISLSFTDAKIGEAVDTWNFVGIDNYIQAFSDPLWWVSVYNTFLFTVTSVSIETTLGLIIALVLNQSFPGRAILRTVVLIPWAIPTVISARLWAWMFHDMFGVINEILMGLQFISEPWAWLANENLAMASVIAVDVWKTTPFMALLILAGLQGIPNEIKEISRIESPSRLRVFYHITLPLIRRTVMVAVIFRTLDALRVFDQIYVLTGTRESTVSMAVYARKRLIDFQEFGYGSTISTLTFFIIALFVILYLRVTMKSQEST